MAKMVIVLVLTFFAGVSLGILAREDTRDIFFYVKDDSGQFRADGYWQTKWRFGHATYGYIAGQ